MNFPTTTEPQLIRLGSCNTGVTQADSSRARTGLYRRGCLSPSLWTASFLSLAGGTCAGGRVQPFMTAPAFSFPVASMAKVIARNAAPVIGNVERVFP